MLEVLRQEMEYEVDPCLAAELRQRLSSVLWEDPHNGGAGYLVRSVYFDPPQTRDGPDDRNKVRLRIYGFGDAPAKLELKQRQGACLRKRSLTLSRRQAELILAGRVSCLEGCGEFGRQMARLMALGAYHPSCLEEHDRIAFYCPANDTRITIDSRLCANAGCFRLYDPTVQLTPVGSPGNTTLGVKYNRFLLNSVRDVVSLSLEKGRKM